MEWNGMEWNEMKSLRNGKQRQAMKLSEASLGSFDASQSRAAFLQMQKSAQEAREKNLGGLCLGESQEMTKTSKPSKLFEKQKLSEASLGNFDRNQSQTAYLEMQNSAAQMRNKNRVGQGIF